MFGFPSFNFRFLGFLYTFFYQFGLLRWWADGLHTSFHRRACGLPRPAAPSFQLLPHSFPSLFSALQGTRMCSMPPPWPVEPRACRRNTVEVGGRVDGSHHSSLTPHSFLTIPRSSPTPQIGRSVPDVARMVGRTPPARGTNWRSGDDGRIWFWSPFFSILLLGTHP